MEATTLLVGLAVAGAVATCARGDDDVVVEAAAVPDGMNAMHQRVSLEQQFDGMIGGIGGGWVEGSRRDAGDAFLAALALELSALDAVVALSESQRVRCDRAARIEAGRARDDIDALRRSCAGRFVDFQTPEGQAEWQRFFGEFQRLQATISAPREATGLLSRTIRECSTTASGGCGRRSGTSATGPVGNASSTPGSRSSRRSSPSPGRSTRR